MKYIFDVVVIVFRRHEIQNVPGANFEFVRTIPGAVFSLFILSLQTPIYDSDENKTNANLHVRNTIGNEALAAPMYEKNPNHLYPQVQIVTNSMANI